MGVNDPQKYDQQLQNERQRLEDSTDVHEVDRTALNRWIHRKDGSVEISSLTAYCRRVRLASARSPTPVMEMDADAYHDLVWRLRHEHDLSDATVKSYENAVLLFVSDMTDADWPDEVDRTSVDDSGPRTDAILTPADIGALTDAARHARDTALIEFLADTGARIGLALSLRVGDVSLSDSPTYTPNPDAKGLKGATIREYPLIDAVAPLRGYLRGSHPRPNDPEVALFHKLKPASRAGPDDPWGDDDGGVLAGAMRQQLYRIAEDAELDKPTNPHAFRHAAITRMVREGYSRSQIEHRVHWCLDSDMWETYEHITSTEHNADIFREAGVVEDDEGPDRVRKPCGMCGDPVAPGADYCANCGSAVSAAAQDEVLDARESVRKDVAAATTPEQRQELLQVLRDLDEAESAAHSDPS